MCLSTSQFTCRPNCAHSTSVTAEIQSSSVQVKHPELTSTRHESRECRLNAGHTTEEQAGVAVLEMEGRTKEQETHVQLRDEEVERCYAVEKPQETETQQQIASQPDEDTAQDRIEELLNADEERESADEQREAIDEEQEDGDEYRETADEEKRKDVAIEHEEIDDEDDQQEIADDQGKPVDERRNDIDQELG